ncbi:MAG: hypothetical protein ACRC1L_15820, partial [Prochlorococcaceae cyanobacterium]
SLAGIGKALAVLAAGAGVEALRRLLRSPLPGQRLPLPNLERLVDLFGALAVVGAALQLALLRLEPVNAELMALEGAWPG